MRFRRQYTVCLLAVLALGAAVAPRFEDRARNSGVDFENRNSPTSRKYLIESMVGGVAMFDYDGDGLLDLYFVNGAALKDPMRKGEEPDKSAHEYWNRLYRNLGGWKFEDVTEKAGVRGRGFGMGVAAGDYDNDGHTDLYVTNFGRNILYRNRGDGTFEDVTAKAGVAGGGWSAGAGFADLDGDGHLDLFVARYLEWDFEPDVWCGARQEGYRSYCHPDQFEPVSHILYRNRGDGTFEDVSAKSGIAASKGKGLGIAFHDFDRDGRLDVLVANDSFPQQLFRNLGGMKFEEVALEQGLAYDEDGRVYAGMGVDFADFDNDGWPDVFINALALQGYAVYRNVEGQFEYSSSETNVAAISKTRSGWGAKFFDFDNDGWKDLFVAQGHVMDNIELTQPALRYREPLLLMRNSKGRFEDVSAEAGEVFRRPLAARGAAFGDLDNDGAIDIAVNILGGRAMVLRNGGNPDHHWLLLKLEGRKSNRDGIGAVVRVVDGEGREQFGIASTASSYLSANDPRVHFGLGGSSAARRIEIRWPSGTVQVLEDVKANQVLPIREP